MGMDAGGLSVADALALSKEDGNGMFGGSGILAIFFIFFILAFSNGGFGGYGNGGGALTRAEMQQGFDNQTAQLHVQAIQSGMYQGFHEQGNMLMNGFNNLGNQITESRFDAQKCCCETNRNIERGACDIINAGNANTQRIIDMFTQLNTQELRDKLQTAELELSNRVQTANIIEAVRPFPVPAYQTCSPYTSNNCGNNCAYAY